MRYYLILNPGSANGKSRRSFNGIKSILNAKGISYDSVVTKHIDDIYNASYNANKSGYDIIVAVGGDGTINSVINGCYDNKGKRISNTKVGVIYTGTSPDFCKSYKIPYKNISKVVTTLLNNKSKKIQIGKITLSSNIMPEFDNRPVDNTSQFKTYYFGCCVNVGLGATIARYANSGIRRVIGDVPGTFISMIRALLFKGAGSYVILCDGKKRIIQNVFNTSIGKTFYVASGIKINNDLNEGDGRFYNLTITDLNLGRLPYCFKSIYSGKKISCDKIFSMKYASVVEIYGNSKNPEVEFDGDAQGFLPCKIEMAEDTLDLIVGD